MSIWVVSVWVKDSLGYDSLGNVVAPEFWRQICYNLVGVVVGGVDNPARTGVALHGLFLDELNTPQEHFGPAGGLKTHHAPLFGSCDRPIKMPALSPNAQKLCVPNIIRVT